MKTNEKMDEPMPHQEKILDLLHSPDEKNIVLGVELAKSQGDKKIEKEYLELYQYFFDPDVTRIEPKHIAELNRPSFYSRRKYGSKLPKSIRRLVRLESLDLSHANLTALPKEIGQLHNLKELNLSFNRLKKLPSVIGQLKQLKFLALYDNRLKTLPTSIGKLSQLESLVLPKNDIRYLPSSLKKLKSLAFLDLSDNHSVAASDYFKHRIRHWLPQARCQLLSFNAVDFYYHNHWFKNKPAYFTSFSNAHFCWLAKHLPSRLKTLWESGDFFDYFEDISKKGMDLFHELVSEVANLGADADMVAENFISMIPLDEMTAQEQKEYMANAQKEFKSYTLQDKVFQTIRDQTDFDFYR